MPCLRLGPGGHDPLKLLLGFSSFWHLFFGLQLCYVWVRFKRWRGSLTVSWASVKAEMVWQLFSSDLDVIVLHVHVVWCAVCDSLFSKCTNSLRRTKKVYHMEDTMTVFSNNFIWIEFNLTLSIASGTEL